MSLVALGHFRPRGIWPQISSNPFRVTRSFHTLPSEPSEKRLGSRIRGGGFQRLPPDFPFCHCSSIQQCCDIRVPQRSSIFELPSTCFSSVTLLCLPTFLGQEMKRVILTISGKARNRAANYKSIKSKHDETRNNYWVPVMNLKCMPAFCIGKRS